MILRRWLEDFLDWITRPRQRAPLMESTITCPWPRWHFKLEDISCVWTRRRMGPKWDSDFQSRYVEKTVFFLNIIKLRGSKNWILHNDNEPCHRFLRGPVFLPQNNIVSLPQPHYSPDLASVGFHLFWKCSSLFHSLYQTLTHGSKKSHEYCDGQSLVNDFDLSVKLCGGSWKCFLTRPDPTAEGGRISSTCLCQAAIGQSPAWR